MILFYQGIEVHIASSFSEGKYVRMQIVSMMQNAEKGPET